MWTDILKAYSGTMSWNLDYFVLLLLCLPSACPKRFAYVNFSHLHCLSVVASQGNPVPARHLAR